MFKLKYLIQTIRSEIQFIYLTAFFAGLLIAFNGNIFFEMKLVFGIVSFLLVHSVGVYFLNAFSDVKIDAINKPDRASAKGLLTEHELLFLGITGYLLGLGLAVFVNQIFFFVLLLTTIIGTIYSLKPIHLKSRGIFCTLTIVYAHSISLVAGAALVGNPLNMPFLHIVILVQSLIAFFVAFAKDIPDMKGDKRYGVNTLAVLLGENNSTKLMILLPFFPLLYLLVPKLWALAPILFIGFIYSIFPLKEKKFMLTFKRGVYVTIIQNLLIIFLLFL